MRCGMRCAMLGVLMPRVVAWSSISQANYGATVQMIHNETLGLDLGTDVVIARQQSLGYLWSFPQSTLDERGLGSSITWAWDPMLCDALLGNFKDDFWGASLIGCSDVKAAMHRAFDTWAMNHRYIKFTEVTGQCAEIGQLNEGCPLAELWITSVAPGLSNTEPASSRTTAPTNFPPDFRSTNGEGRIRHFGNGEHIAQRQVAETQRGVIAFASSNTCWYLDSGFCSGWHEFKEIGGDNPDSMYVVGVTFLVTIWIAAMLAMCVAFAYVVKQNIRLHIKVDKNEDEKENAESAGKRLSPSQERFVGFIFTLATTPIMPATLRFLLLMIPWAFFQGIFVTCWSCYDFEAAAAQEIGHMLGLAHPDMLPRETLEGYPRTGQNVYHTGLAAGGRFDSTTCNTAAIWANVRVGVPPGAETRSQTGVRPSIMEHLTQHNPRTCLTADDLEAINVLYPDCLGGMTEPVCAKSPYNIGNIRLLLWLVVPFLVSVLAAIVLHLAAKWKLRQVALRNGLTLKYLGNKPCKPVRAKVLPNPTRSNVVEPPTGTQLSLRP